MSEVVSSPLSTDSATSSRRGQSFVEFALVLPLLLVLLLGIADFGRVFQDGIVLEGAARNASEAAAQEYLQLRRATTPAGAVELDRIAADAKSAVCEEAARLTNRQVSSGSCVLPFTAICIHDDPTELVNYGTGCGEGSGLAPPECSNMHAPWPSLWATGRLPSVEVRVCYRFDTLVNLADVRFPFGGSLSLGSVWLERDRVFTVADY